MPNTARLGEVLDVKGGEYMKLREKFEHYTEQEFTQLVNDIFECNGSESYQDELLENFISVSGHPEGADLIYYNFDENMTPEKIVKTLKDWRRERGLPLFKTEDGIVNNNLNEVHSALNNDRNSTE